MYLYLFWGVGFDNGTKLDVYGDLPEDRLTFSVGFHHINANGFDDGWTHHEIIVTPSLTHGFNLRITGRDKNNIKVHIAEVFNGDLNEIVDPEDERKMIEKYRPFAHDEGVRP